MALERQTNTASAPATVESVPSISPPPFLVPDRSVLDFGTAVREPWDYVPVPPVGMDDDGYLVSDALPKTQRYTTRMLAYGAVLTERYRGRGGTVGLDLSMPYVQGSPGKVLVPDLFVALSAEERDDREHYKLWREPTPDFVLEDLSPTNWRQDAVDKRELYRRFGVREYWMLDETRRWLHDDSGTHVGEWLVGYRLRSGEYERVQANDAGRLPSKVLDLELCVRDGLVRFYDPTVDRYLPTYDELFAHLRAVGQRAGRQPPDPTTGGFLPTYGELLTQAAEARAADDRAVREAALARIEALEAELAQLRQ